MPRAKMGASFEMGLARLADDLTATFGPKASILKVVLTKEAHRRLLIDLGFDPDPPKTTRTWMRLPGCDIEVSRED